MNSAPAPSAAREPTKHVATLFVLVVFLGILWRLPYAAGSPLLPGDEIKYSLTTVEHLEAGEFLTYMYGSDYGGPIHEWFAVLFRKVLGPSALALRLPVMLFGSFAAGLFFLSLRTALRVGPAFALSLLVACPPSTAALYTVSAQPAYAATLFFIALIQLATFWVDRSRTVRRWALLGLLMGAALYIFKLSALQSGASLIWLFLRSSSLREILAQIGGDFSLRRRAARAAACTGGMLLALAPVAYRALTRRGDYHISKPEIALLLVAALLALGAVLFCVPLVRFSKTALVRGATFAATFALVAVVPGIRFSQVEKPRLLAAGVRFYGEATYALKPLHEWPFQAKLFAERVFPALIFGRLSELEPLPTNGVHCGWRTIFTAGFFAALCVMAFRQRSRAPLPNALRADFVIIVPFLLVVAIMAPSWQLHGDFCFRYLLLFFPGLLLVAYRCSEPALQHWPKCAVLLLAAYLLHAGWDCREQIPATVEIARDKATAAGDRLD